MMPMQRALYPDDWPDISLRIREREGWCCKWCGVASGALVTGARGQRVRVVLSVAHLDHDPANCADDNLAALCAPCHLRYDIKHHKRSAANTRKRRQVEAGQCELFTAEDSA